MLFRHAFAAVHSGIELRSVHSAEEALQALDSGDAPSLLLLDLNMPGQGGFHFLRARRDQGYLHFPVIVVSSSPADEDIRQSYSLGANSYVTKPFDYEELKCFAEALLSYWLNLAKLPYQQ